VGLIKEIIKYILFLIYIIIKLTYFFKNNFTLFFTDCLTGFLEIEPIQGFLEIEPIQGLDCFEFKKIMK
jgi:hypothetical protein